MLIIVQLKLQGSAALDPELTHQTRAYTTWLNWWRTTIDSEDYLKFASKEVCYNTGSLEHGKGTLLISIS